MPRALTRTLMSAALLAAPVIAAPVAAQATGQSTADSATLAPVVVTATRLPLALVAPPVSTTVITGAELRERGITTVADALRNVAGVDVVQVGSMGGLTSVFLRGGQSDYVKVLLDGVPLNEPGGAFYFQNLTTENVDRIEVVRGPASVLYGSDAVTGVVQVFTTHGSGAPAGSIAARGGTYGTSEELGDLHGGAGPVGYSVGADHSYTNGILPFNNQDLNNSVTARADVGSGSATSASLTARYHNSDYHYPTEGDGTPLDHNQHEFEEGTDVALEGGHVFAPTLEARGLLTLNSLNVSDLNPQDSPADTIGTYISRSRDAYVRDAADARALARVLPAGGIVTVGGTIEQERDRNGLYDVFNFSGFTGSDSASGTPRRTTRAAYAEAAGNVGRWGSYTAGTRLDDSRFGTFGTWRAGFGVATPTFTHFHANAGTSYKEPTLFETSSLEPGDYGNPMLRPERSIGWEIGVDQSTPNGRLSASATYFWQRFQDLIDYTFNVPTDTSPNYFNVAAARAFGVELELSALVTNRLSAHAQYTGLTTRTIAGGFDTSSAGQLLVGTPLIRRPAHSASGTLTYALPRRGSSAVTVRYVGARQDIDFTNVTEPRVVLPGYTVVDVAAEYRILALGRSAMSVTGRVSNLFDRRYDEIATYAAPGRIILVGGRLDVGG